MNCHDCCETLGYNRPNWNVIEQDIVKVAEQGIGTFLREEDWDIDLLSRWISMEGIPVIREKLGLNDVQGNHVLLLFLQTYCRILNPKMFLVENVAEACLAMTMEEHYKQWSMFLLKSDIRLLIEC